MKRCLKCGREMYETTGDFGDYCSNCKTYTYSASSLPIDHSEETKIKCPNCGKMLNIKVTLKGSG